MGSGNWDKDTAQGIAQKAIAVAEARQDAVAFISPYRGAFLSDNSVGTVTVNDIDTITKRGFILCFTFIYNLWCI